MLDDTKTNFLSILNFVSRFLTIKIDEKKVSNSLNTTNFEKLRSMEKKFGFIESVKSLSTKKRINFFNLGKKNNWKEKLDNKIARKIENLYKKEMNELKYL